MVPPAEVNSQNQPGGLRSGYGHKYSRQKRSCSSFQTHDAAAGANSPGVNTPSKTESKH